MSLECYIGPEQNLLDATPEHCHRLLVEHPILTNEEVSAIKNLDENGWRSQTIDITFAREEGEAGLLPALDRICEEAEQAIENIDKLVDLHTTLQVGVETIQCIAIIGWHL